MLTLVCALVGVEGSAFPVDIEAKRLVGHLKDEIKEKLSNYLKAIDAHRLDLFLAKKGETANAVGTATKAIEGINMWLRHDDQAVQDLLDGNVDNESIQQMIAKENKKNETWSIQEWLDEKNMVVPTARQIHILVVVRGGDFSDGTGILPQFKMTPLTMMLTKCEVVGDLPSEKDASFLKLFEWSDFDCGTVIDIQAICDIVHFTGPQLYLRKEILCVLENFKKIYQQELTNNEVAEVVNKQFILMGSPGMGKSCILALLCFYMAVQCKKPVRVEWEGDTEGKIYKSLYDAMKASGINPIHCWFCLDGVDQTQIWKWKWFNMYKLLATSSCSGPLFWTSEASSFQVPCVVPYWKQVDLQDLASKLKDPKENDFETRYFVSGGSLRDFLSGVVGAKYRVVRAMNRITKPEDADNLHCPFGRICDKQIGGHHLRMLGVEDTTKATHFVDISCWSWCVSSKLALTHLAANRMQPIFF